MPSFNDYFANMGQNALSGALSTRDALNERRDIQNRQMLQGQLPALIEQSKIPNKNALSLLASTNPEQAMEYLMNISKPTAMTGNYAREFEIRANTAPFKKAIDEKTAQIIKLTSGKRVLTEQERAEAQQLSFEISQLQNDIFSAGGAPYKSQFAETYGLGQEQTKIEQDRVQGDVKNKEAIDKRATQEIEGYAKNSQKTLEKIGGINEAVARLNQIQEDENPASLFASVKLLSNVIEPGLSVNEGEVRGYMGANWATELLQNIGTAKNLYNGLTQSASIAEAQAKTGNQNPETIKQMKVLARNLQQAVIGLKQSAVNGGVNTIVDNLKQDLRAIYGDAIPQEVIDGFASRAKSRLEANMTAMRGFGQSTPISSAKQVKAQPQKAIQNTKPTTATKKTIKPKSDPMGLFN